MLALVWFLSWLGSKGVVGQGGGWRERSGRHLTWPDIPIRRGESVEYTVYLPWERIVSDEFLEFQKFVETYSEDGYKAFSCPDKDWFWVITHSTQFNNFLVAYAQEGMDGIRKLEQLTKERDGRTRSS